MSNFDISIEKVLKFEGGYSYHKDDKGGETFMGISRVHHPDWAGWAGVDADKNDVGLKHSVKEFYKKEYWDKFKGDNIHHVKISSELLDTSINMGVKRAIIFLQKGINALNRNGKDFSDIKVDGKVGPNTISKLDILIKKGDAHHLHKLLNIQQGRLYMEIMDRNPQQEVFARGWLKRVEITIT